MVRNQRNVWILMLAAMSLLTVPLGCTKEPIKPIENPDRVDTVPNPKPDTIPDPKPNPNPQPSPSPDPGKAGAVDSIMVDVAQLHGGGDAEVYNPVFPPPQS